MNMSFITIISYIYIKIINIFNYYFITIKNKEF